MANFNGSHIWGFTLL